MANMAVDMTTILLLEDDPAIAATLQFSLQREGWQVLWADMVAKVLPLLKHHQNIDAVILDIGLPDGSGFDVCKMIRQGDLCPFVPILFLTARDDEVDTIIGLEMGADDYIAKPFSSRELIARIKAIWRRQNYIPGSQKIQSVAAKTNSQPADLPNLLSSVGDFVRHTQVGVWTYQQSDYSLMLNNTAIALSKTELAIMLTLLQNPERILTREQILNHISQHPEHRLARTIDSHIKTLRQKLACISADEIILTHRGLGYSLC
jgi:two component transcriptional regulator, winged helix family